MATFELSAYERAAHDEILAWRDKDGNAWNRSMRGLTSYVSRGLSNSLPSQLTQAVFHAVSSGIEQLEGAAQWTHTDASLLREAAKLGLHVEDVMDLARFELEQLDPLARRFFGPNRLIAALEGAGTGLGGPLLIAADIPALFAVSFRAIQQIGGCYGFDTTDPELRPVVLSVLGAGAAQSSAAKAQALLDMRIAARAFAAGVGYQRVAEMTATGVAARALKKVSEHLPRDIAKEISRRKLAQLLPFIGAAVGATFNHWFLSTTCESAYMLFRELYLERKYPGFSGSLVADVPGAGDGAGSVPGDGDGAGSVPGAGDSAGSVPGDGDTPLEPGAGDEPGA
ncbi:MAG TPA: EcsC family protein [Polyangiaceae bacterium]|nr:EcsC family protein [Polyangiaceae bacterium]